MSAFTYSRTYFVTDRVLSVINSPNQLIQNYPPNTRVYFDGTTFVDGNILLDISAFLSRETLIGITDTQSIVDRFTDILCDRYKTTDVPIQDIITGSYLNRVEVLDATGEDRFDIQFTMINDPGLRDQIDTKNLCSDLVIAGKNGHSVKDTIFTVNGIGHKQIYDVDNNEMYLVDGYLNCRRKNETQICSIDFSSVGGIKSDTSIMDEDILGDINSNGYIYIRSHTPLRGTYPILFIDGYMFYDTEVFKIISPDVIRIDMRKIGIPSLYVQNPMTQYKRGVAYRDNTAAGTDFEFPDTIDKQIYLDGNPGDQPILDSRGKELFPYPKIYRSDSLLANTYFLEENFNNEKYIRHMLTNGQSRIVLVNCPNLKIRKYTGVHVYGSYQYDVFSHDTPRGMLKYNKKFVIPYTIMSNGENRIHHLHLGIEKITKDLYKTRDESPIYLAPRVDEQQYAQGFPVELTEMYTS